MYALLTDANVHFIVEETVRFPQKRGIELDREKPKKGDKKRLGLKERRRGGG